MDAMRRKQQSSWAWQSYMGYAYEAFSTWPATEQEGTNENPEGWSGDVNTNVQVRMFSRQNRGLSADERETVVQVSRMA